LPIFVDDGLAAVVTWGPIAARSSTEGTASSCSDDRELLRRRIDDPLPRADATSIDLLRADTVDPALPRLAFFRQRSPIN
jgi:hypothetical protein